MGRTEKRQAQSNPYRLSILRDMSLAPRTAAGRKARGTFLTLRKTARKLGVNF